MEFVTRSTSPQFMQVFQIHSVNAIVSLLIFVALILPVSEARKYEKLLFSDIQTLTFYQGRWTESRRVDPVPQLTCLGKLCKKFQARVIQCQSRGDAQWKVSSL